MNCKEFDKYMTLFLEGNLEDEELQEFHQHVASCEMCEKKFLEEYRLHNELKEVITSLPEASPSFRQMLIQFRDLISSGVKDEEFIMKFDEVFDNFKKGVADELSEEDVDLYVQTLILEAQEYIKAGNYAAAVKCFQEAQKLRPNDAEIGKRFMEMIPLELYVNDTKRPLTVEGGNVSAPFDYPVGLLRKIRVDFDGKEECQSDFHWTRSGDSAPISKDKEAEPLTFGSDRITVLVEPRGDVFRVIIKFKK